MRKRVRYEVWRRIGRLPAVATLAVLWLLTAGPLLAGGGAESPADEEILSMEFPEVVEAARNTEVSFFMWGGDAKINRWVDNFVTDELSSRYGIRLKRVPMDASVFVNKLLTEKLAGRERGTIDLMWINGENFKRAKEAELLFGPYAERLPSMRLTDPAEAGYDFGFPVEGYEAPYGKAQFVFAYDPTKIGSPPASFAELLEWAKRNPGRFTYPQPPDFTGSAFIRQVFYATTGGHRQYLEGWDESRYRKKSPAAWAYLNELAPYLWQEGRTYPKDKKQLDLLFERGEVDIVMSYHQAEAAGRVLEGRYPPSVRTFVMEEGSISNIHFTAIPFNAPNKGGAMVVSEFLLSPDAQIHKNDPANWGDFTALDVTRLSAADRERLAAIDLGEATLPFDVLARHAVPEVLPRYLEALEDDWERFVLGGGE